MSTTPRTDVARVHISYEQGSGLMFWPNITGPFVRAEASESLETELNQWKACSDKLGEELSKMRVQGPEEYDQRIHFKSSIDALREYEALKKGGE